MQEIASLLNTVLFLFIWTSSLKLCQCDSNADCNFTESYDAVVTVSVKEPVYVTKNKWCWDVPPRCTDNQLEYRIVQKNITIPKIRIVKRCCKDQIQLYDNCISKCNENQCPNIQCAPDTNKCKCKPGYTGQLCNQRCYHGFWGMNCKNTCHKACADCDHRTGCCKTPISDNRVIEAELTLCTTSKTTTPIPIPLNDSEHKEQGENDHTARSRKQISQTVTHEPRVLESIETKIKIQPILTRTPVETQNPVALVSKHQSITEDIMVEETTLSSSSSPPPPSNRLQKDGFVGTVTKVEVMVYKYDELVKKLIWISAMTVISIAIVFIIMFVMFLKCYGVSKVDDRIKNQQSMSARKFNETCISTQNLGHVPPDRYTKAPALCTSTNDGLPIHPDIFCPVFSAPHYTNGLSIYDSPQPLYEIIC